MNMQGKQDHQMRALQVLNLETLVPTNHILRHIDHVLDLSFLRPMVADLYSPDKGRPSYPPELVLRMFLLSYLYNLSDVRVCEEVAMHAGFRWFCRLHFDDPVPDRTTLVKIRKRWGEAGVFEQVMRQVVQRCIDAGLVRGRRLAVDGTQVTANAATNSLEPLAPVQSLESYLQRVRQEDGAADSDDADDPQDPPDAPAAPSRRQGGNPDFHGERFSNRTHRSATDPDARLYRKGANQEAKLRYLAHNLMDLDSGVILDTKATQAASWAERAAAREMVTAVLPLLPQYEECKLFADAGYQAGEFLADILALGVLPIVPMTKLQLEPLPTWKRPPRDLHQDHKRSQRRRQAKARNTVREQLSDRRLRQQYRARIRIEHGFAEAKECHGLDRARSRGLPKMHWQALLTATVQNLKRLAKFARRRQPPRATALGACQNQVAQAVSRLYPALAFLFSSLRLRVPPKLAPA